MKIMIYAFEILLILFASASIASAQEANEMKKDSAGVKEASINLPTMKCGQCKKTITGALTNAEGVKEVNIDLKKKTAMIKYVDSKVSLSNLRLAIAKAGYDADNVKRDSTGYQQLDSCCK